MIKLDLHYPNAPALMDRKIQLVKLLKIALDSDLSTAKAILDHLQATARANIILRGGLPQDLAEELTQNNIHWEITSPAGPAHSETDDEPRALDIDDILPL